MDEYKVFRVMGKVYAGDNASARIYGVAIATGRAKGPGSINEKNFLYVRSPVDSEYTADNYQGFCTFLGVINGSNTYLPIAVQPNYIDAANSLDKWEKISEAIRGEINMVYLPYRKKIKDQEAAEDQAQQKSAAEQRNREVTKANADAAKAKEQRNREVTKANADAAKANAEAEKQARIDQAKVQLAQAQREVEQAKINQSVKRDADAEVARIQAEIEKANVEKARIEAETQKQAQEAANLKAQQLQDTETKEKTAIAELRNTVSVIPGKQLGKIKLGMSEAQVLQLIGAPNSTLELRKPEPRPLNIYNYSDNTPVFIPRKIRRDRYALGGVSGMNITYYGSPVGLKYFATKRGLDNVKSGDLKEDFVFDVFYVNGKVIQIETDSPQFFGDKGVNGLDLKISAPYDSGFVRDYGFVSTDRENGSSLEFGSGYAVDRESGFSLKIEVMYMYLSLKELSSFPEDLYSLLKVVIHYPKTLPYTGDYQLGLSLNNKKGRFSDADSAEERMFTSPLNSSPVSQVADQEVKAQKESLKKKLKRKLGDFLP